MVALIYVVEYMEKVVGKGGGSRIFLLCVSYFLLALSLSFSISISLFLSLIVYVVWCIYVLII